MDEVQKERCGYYAMNRIFGYEPMVAVAIIENLGSAARVFEMDDEELDLVLGPYSKYRKHINRDALAKAGDELMEMERKGIRFITRNDSCFPSSLLECDDCPAGLFIRSGSSPEEVFDAPAFVSVVGTRDISPYGREWCRRLVAAIASCRKKPVIVSGLAIGADITAHLAALEYGLPTIGILPCGVNDVYPSRHRHYAAEIASAQGSALVTDYPPGTMPTASTFLRRNRIIAGMSFATIVIESKVKGGAMITANLAFSYGRELYALPGRADDIRSMGCNYLIKARMAEAIFDENTLIESLGFDGRYRRRGLNISEAVKRFAGNVDSKTLGMLEAVLKLVVKHRGISIDEIGRSLGIGYRDIAVVTGLLENDGIIKIDLMQRCVISV